MSFLVSSYASWCRDRHLDDTRGAPLGDGLSRVSAKGCRFSQRNSVPGLGVMGRFLEMMRPMSLSTHVGVEGLMLLAELADLGRPEPGEAQQRLQDLAAFAQREPVTQADREVLRVAVLRLMDVIHDAANDEPKGGEREMLYPVGHITRDGQGMWVHMRLIPPEERDRQQGPETAAKSDLEELSMEPGARALVGPEPAYVQTMQSAIPPGGDA
uniref:Uncharacterized protein n=1 Tax=Magnetococcus massalia (strain MO-1) TaxID=451514 RepID=A0A1S7LPF9_MAGMO|nr:Protein of unknown function [Candidatus Magnetococcus massalia]